MNTSRDKSATRVRRQWLYMIPDHPGYQSLHQCALIAQLKNMILRKRQQIIAFKHIHIPFYESAIACERGDLRKKMH